eukprot:414248-Amphidinium_carterae.1
MLHHNSSAHRQLSQGFARIHDQSIDAFFLTSLCQLILYTLVLSATQQWIESRNAFLNYEVWVRAAKREHS